MALAAFVVCLCALPAAGQEYQWFRQLSGTGVNNSVGNDVVTDASGNSYVVGKFGGTVNFGGSNTLVSHSPTGDIFFAKYDVNGNAVLVRGVGASNATCHATGAAIFKDASNNVFLYISGYFSGSQGTNVTVDFSPNLPGGELTTADTNGDAFVVKYNLNLIGPGSTGFVWATRIPNTGGDFASGGKVAVDGVGDAYHVNTVQPAGGFLRKLTSSAGTISWSNNITPAGGGANNVVVQQNVVHVCGAGLGSPGRPVAWYNTSGTLLGSVGATSRNFLSLAVSSSGSRIFGGGQTGNVANPYEVAIEAFDKTNVNPVWSKNFTSGISGLSIDVAVDETVGDLMVAGWFKGTVNFNNPGSYTSNLTSSGSGVHDNIFVARYFASSGNVEWVKNNTSNSSNGQSAPLALACANQSVYVLSFLASRTINASFCGAARNVVADNTNNGVLIKYTQRLWPSNGVSGSSSTFPGDPEDYTTIGSLPAAKSYNWFYPPNWIITRDDHTSSIFVHPESSGSVAVQVVYECGTSSLASLFVTVSGSGGGGHKLATVYPNPTSETLTVDLQNVDAPATAQLIDGSGNIVQEKNFDPSASARSLTFEVSNVPTGQYFLHLNSKGRVLQEHVSIKH